MMVRFSCKQPFLQHTADATHWPQTARALIICAAAFVTTWLPAAGLSLDDYIWVRRPHRIATLSLCIC